MTKNVTVEVDEETLKLAKKYSGKNSDEGVVGFALKKVVEAEGLKKALRRKIKVVR